MTEPEPTPDFDWVKIRDWLEEVGFEEWGSKVPANQAEWDRFWTFLDEQKKSVSKSVAN